VIIKFEIGKTYYDRSMADYDTIFTFEVFGRTDKTVTTRVHGQIVQRRIKVRDGIETFAPFGSYSMSSVVYADHTPPPEAS